MCERENRTAIYWPPLLWPSALYLSRSPGLLNWRLGGSAFCWVLAFSTTSCHQWVSETTGGPEGPFGRECLSLPHLISNFSGPQLSDFLSSQSYIIVQRPLNPWNGIVWSSPSGNNCHAVQRSLSSGASVYECIMGFLPCPILLAKSTYAISPHKCHWNVSLPSSASLWNGIFGQVEGQYTTNVPVHNSTLVHRLFDQDGHQDSSSPSL